MGTSSTLPNLTDSYGNHVTSQCQICSLPYSETNLVDSSTDKMRIEALLGDTPSSSSTKLNSEDNLETSQAVAKLKRELSISEKIIETIDNKHYKKLESVRKYMISCDDILEQSFCLFKALEDGTETPNAESLAGVLYMHWARLRCVLIEEAEIFKLWYELSKILNGSEQRIRVPERFVHKTEKEPPVETNVAQVLATLHAQSSLEG